MGRAGEDAAASEYLRRGFTVLTRNWRCRTGEIDVVAARPPLLVFCEVKTRSGSALGGGYEAVTVRKQRKLRQLAEVFMAANGKKDEALKIARDNVNLMPASYNLAAIYAQNGQRDKALALLRRHFYQYERYNSVRAKEMMEARVDAVFDSIRSDRQFIALTKGADGRLPIPMKGMPATQASPNR